MINEVLAEHSGQPADKLELDSDRDYFMTAPEAKEYGLVDQVIDFKQKEPAAAGRN